MQNIPNHIAFIPDGNRRWAKKHKLEAWKGHEEGAERFEDIAEFLLHYPVSYVTLWLASEDNLTKRSNAEVQLLVSLLQKWLAKELASGRFLKDRVRFRFIGRWNTILKKNTKTDELKKSVRELEGQTKHFNKKNLTVLFGYDGQREMVEAIEKIKEQPEKKISYETVHHALWTGMLPPVDFVIRTGGEPHWSAGFMMWHTAYSQLYFTKTLWPDFKKNEIEKALDDYSKRERRFGK